MNVLHKHMKKLDELIWANLACLCVSARRQEEVGYGG